MKRRNITAILLALALAVSSAAMLTGCAGKSYYYDKNGNRIGPIGASSEEASKESVAESTPAESTPSETTPSETTTEESSQAESVADTSSEAPADESSEEASKDEAPADGDVLATIKFEKPDDWSADDLSARVYDDESNTANVKPTADGNVYTFVVPKKGEQGNEFKSPKIMFQSVAAGFVIQTEGATIDGDKTYGVGELIKRGQYAIVEK